jgi:tape measure domain-containing protein
MLVALDGNDEGLQRTLKSAERSMADLAATAKGAGERMAAGFAQVKAGAEAFGEQFNKARTQLLAFVGIQWVAGKAGELIQLADAWNQMNARLKLATTGQQEFAVAQREVFEIAQRTGAPIEQIGTLYGKVAQAVRMMGGEQSQALQLTEMIAQALKLSGASAQQSEAAMLQLSQALAAGVLRGEEFNSVTENAPRLMQALSEGLGLPIGALRKYAEEGRLTADVVTKAWISQKDKISAEFAQLPKTFEQSTDGVRNAFVKMVGGFDEATGATKKLAAAFTWVAQHMTELVAVLKLLAEVGLGVLVYRMVPALITAWQTVQAAGVAAAAATSAAWATASLSIQGAVAQLGVLRTAFLVLAAFFAGWKVGEWLSEHFAMARKAGGLMVGALMLTLEQLQFQWESFKALFTGDTLAAAAERHAQRLGVMVGTLKDMWAEAGQAGEQANAAMNASAAGAEEIAKRLEAVRLGTQEAVTRGVDAVHAGLEKLKTRLGEVEAAFNKANGTVNDATAKMGEAFKGLTAQVEQGLQRQGEAVKRRYDQERAELENSRQSQEAVLTKSTALLADAMAQQTTLRQRATADTLRLIDQESGARIDAARRQGQTDAERAANVQRVENEILATKRTTLDQALQDYRQHVDQLNAEANRHLAEVKRIEEEKRSLSLSTEDRIREIQRQGLSDFEANEDKKRQIAELQEKAREALHDGEFDHARQFAKQAMDLASEVAGHETQEAKKGQEARQQAEAEQTKVVQLGAQARDAARKGENEQAQAYMRQAAQLQAELSAKMHAADAEASKGKDGTAAAIQRIKEAEDLLNQALDAEGKAHKDAAATAVAARGEVEQALAKTQSQLDDITAKLKDGLKLTIDADTTRLTQALADLDKAIAEKHRLMVIQADLQQAQKQLQDYEQQLKEGKAVTIGADTTKAKAALAELQTYARDGSHIELRVATEKAQAAIANVDAQVRALDRIKTESQHEVLSNYDNVRAQITSLNGLNTSSTHTVYVQRVEAHATGGPVGVDEPVMRFAQGGPVRNFPRMRDGKVPGTGDGDTVPRTLQAGAFVLRKAAVRQYGEALLSKLAGVQHFKAGGPVKPIPWPPEPEKKNREVVELQQMIELGQKAENEYMGWLVWNYGAAVSLDAPRKTAEYWGTLAHQDRRVLEELQNRKTLTAHEKQQLEEMRGRWRTAMAQPLTYGKDYERELIAYMEEHQGEFFANGGRAKSDTVPAMLTPGEYVINRDTVSRLGVGFFEALNALKVPAKALSGRVQGFASGGFVQPSAGLAQALPGADLGARLLASITGAMRVPAPTVVMTAAAAPGRTIRVELAAGDRTVAATVDARDESRLLDLLQQARGRSR